jgi:hypothetical protein
MAKRRCCLLVAIALTYSTGVAAQSLTIGSLGVPSGLFYGRTPLTVVDYAFPASRDGFLTSATFQWSATPCKAAVMIKLFYVYGFIYNYELYLDGARGPFDVVQSTQTVALVPPLAVREGEFIAVTSLTDCGTPVRGTPGASFVLPGDAGQYPFACLAREGCTAGGDSPAIEAVGEPMTPTLTPTNTPTPTPRRRPRVVPFRQVGT